MNDNSSRFIKFLSLQFCEKKRTLAGGRIRYILFGYVLKRYINIEYWPDKDYIVNMEANVLSFLKSILYLIFHFYRTRASLRKYSELLQQWSWAERIFQRLSTAAARLKAKCVKCLTSHRGSLALK